MSKTIIVTTWFVLAAVVLVGAHLVSANRQLGTSLTHDELLKQLNGEKLSPDTVSGLLSRTEDKNKKGVIGEYSVGQLVTLNSLLNKYQCDIVEMSRRRDICRDLNRSKLSYVNLHGYCSDRLERLRAWCREEGFKNSMI